MRLFYQIYKDIAQQLLIQKRWCGYDSDSWM